jgi:hypothetical protein
LQKPKREDSDSEMSEKKVVNRGIALGIGVLCVVLLVAIVGAVLIYTSMLNNKDIQIADLQRALGQKC